MSSGRAMSLPMIQVLTPERQRAAALPNKINQLLNEVRQLRDDTDSLVCNCKQPDCPFLYSHSNTIHQVSCSLDLVGDSPKTRRKAITKSVHPHVLKVTPSLNGIERRSDGTIVEKDGPRTISMSGEESLEKRLMRSSMYSSGSLGKHLSVSNTLSDSQDCLVDSDNLFGTSSDDDSTFSRFEPTRRIVRLTPKTQRRGSLIPESNTFPNNLRRYRQSFSACAAAHQYRFSLHLRSAASLPSCASYFEDDEESMSTCSSSSSISTTPPITTHSRPHSGLIISS